MVWPQDSGDQYRVYTLRYGTRQTTRSDVFLDYNSYGEPDGPHIVDYYFWVLQSDHRLIVVDTGYDAEVAHRRQRTVLHDPVNMLREFLHVEPDDVETVVITHCHYDHIGNLARFPNARVHLAEAELDFIRSGLLDRPLVGHFTEPAEVELLDRLRRSGRLTVVREECELAPGIRLIPVGGHTPGQLMVEVNTANGAVLLTSDALHFVEELDRDMPYISSMDLPATYQTFDIIRERVAARSSQLVAGHDSGALNGMSRLSADIGWIG